MLYMLFVYIVRVVICLVSLRCQFVDLCAFPSHVVFSRFVCLLQLRYPEF